MENTKNRVSGIQEIMPYTLAEVSEATGFALVTLRKYIKEGTLDAYKIGRRWYVSKEALAAFITEKKGN